VPDPTATTPDALEVLPTSDPAIRTIAMPADTNPHGDIFGGWLLCQMDLAGSTVATRRANGRVVTVAITAMAFHRPVLVGDEVSCFCNIEKIGNTSIAVRIESWARRGTGGAAIKVTEGLFTYVHVGADGHSQPIAPAAT
jgi:acyl-CoA thioesterase YciA